MWQAIVSESSLAQVVVKNLLLEQPEPSHSDLHQGYSCNHNLAVGFWLTPSGVPLSSLSFPSPPQPLILSCPALEAQPPSPRAWAALQGQLYAEGHPWVFSADKPRHAHDPASAVQ